MTSYKNQDKKCLGCGIKLSLDKDSIGYVPKITEQTALCQRCFKLRHYGVVDDRNLDQTSINQTNMNATISSDSYVCLVVDPFNLKNSLIDKYKNHKKLIIVINKIDLFKPYRNLEIIKKNLIDNIRQLGYDPLLFVFCFAKSKSNVKNFLTYIYKLDNSKDHKNMSKQQKITLIFVGISNVGKSTIINNIINQFNKSNKKSTNVTISDRLNTTILTNKIKVSNNLTIVDTPGFTNDSSILNFINSSDIKKVNPNKITKIRNFQIRSPKRIMIENLVAIDIIKFDKSSTANINLLMNDILKTTVVNVKSDCKFTPNSLKLISYSIDDMKIECHTFKFTKKRNDLFISSLVVINTRNIKEIKIWTPIYISVDKINFNIL